MMPEVLTQPTGAASVPLRRVFAFGGGMADDVPGGAAVDLLGGKGAGLAEMSRLGLPVPPGFTITTEVCTHYYANGETYPGDLEAQVQAALEKVEGVVSLAPAPPFWNSWAVIGLLLNTARTSPGTCHSAVPRSS